MLTGLQISEACDLLKWSRLDLQRRTALPLAVIDRALMSPDGAVGRLADEIVIKDAFYRAGVEFGPDGVRMRGESQP